MISGPAGAGDGVAELFRRQLDLVENDLVRLAEAMPGSAYDFRPEAGAFDGVRTFGEQVKHAATIIYLTAAIVLEEKSPYAPGPDDTGPPEVQGKEAILRYLNDAILYARRAVGSLTAANQLDPLKTFFGVQPRIEVAAGIIYHSYNHYGQLAIYARMNGIVPGAVVPTMPR